MVESDDTSRTRREDGESLPSSRRLIVAFRVALLVLAAGAVVAAAAIGRGGDGGEAGVHYVCPMHPEVRSRAPGECPICRMALEPTGRDVKAGGMAHGGMANGSMPGMPDITAVDNVRKHRIIDFLRQRSLPINLRELRGPALVRDDGQLEAIFYDDQIAALDRDQAGSFSPGRTPAITFAVARTGDPIIRVDRSTARVRFRLVGGGARARTTAGAAPMPGQVGWIEIERKPREVLSVPSSAILQSPEGPYVLAWLGNGNFEKRPIEIGETFLKQGFAVVLGGMQLHDRVVSRAAFFLDADRRLNRRDVGEARTEMQVAP